MRFGYVHFAFLGPESLLAAEASECAADQNAFWAYHDALFTIQNGESGGAYQTDSLKDVAAQLGLDMPIFSECLDSGKHRDLVQEESAWVRSIGVQSTPAFVLDGQPIVGAQPFEVFQQAIEARLNR